MSTSPKLRCAVYTRKSSEEGLEQEFNSLHAQREACAAFVMSQAGLGWTLLPDAYDDGGLSGGTMERPALQRLLQDIRERKVDVVVVYKIDRLTRSLMDFARIVEVFDQHSVSFVSVTQAFNTTTSMGRLTLNVLLSFAQFEREVTAERIRDKIAASKRKGMWMGGRVALGYRADNKKLVIDEKGAAKVRGIFARYLELGSVSLLADELNRQTAGLSGGIEAVQGRADLQPAASSMIQISRGQLYHLLSNPLYIGKLRHKGQVHEGEHEAIITQEVFEAAQALLASQAPLRRARTNAPDLHLLTGILFDETGDRLAPAHATNHGRRYRYYVSGRLKGRKPAEGQGWRLPASEIEAAVAAQLEALLGDSARLAAWITTHASAGHVSAGLATASLLQREMANSNSPHSQRAAIRSIVQRVDLSPTRLEISIDEQALVLAMLGPAAEQIPGQLAASRDGSCPSSAYRLVAPIAIRRRGLEARVVVNGTASSRQKLDRALVNQLARAHLFLAKLTDGQNRTISDVADLCGVHRADVSRILPLAFLAPSITSAILAGQQPADLTARRLARLPDLPIGWNEQMSALGC